MMVVDGNREKKSRSNYSLLSAANAAEAEQLQGETEIPPQEAKELMKVTFDEVLDKALALPLEIVEPPLSAPKKTEVATGLQPPSHWFFV